MILLKKFAVMGMLFTAVSALSACDSVLFPEYDDEDVYVGEGGRVVRTIPGASNSLRADIQNAAYETGNAPDVMAEKPIPAEDKIKPVKTTPVASSVSDEEVSLADDEMMTMPAEIERVKPATKNPVMVEAKPAEVKEVASLMDEPKGPSVSYRIDTFMFDNGSSELGGENMQRVRQIVKEAKAHNAAVVVYGYASSRTRNTDEATHKLANFKVSMERATSVANSLKRAGMLADKIEVQAMSDTSPMYQEVMPEGERLNRRAEVYISY